MLFKLETTIKIRP